MGAAAWSSKPCALPDALAESLGHLPIACLRGDRDWLLLYEDATAIADLQPDFELMRALGDVGIIATAATGPSSFAFRFFCPGFSIGEDEDPGTGSAISTLAPFWAELKGDQTFSVKQLSERTAQFECRLLPDSVELISEAVTVGRSSR